MPKTIIASKKLDYKLLIVDDNTSNNLLLEKILKLNGFIHIKTCVDSRNVVELCQTYWPDLLILDFRMPYLDGFDVINQLHAKNIHTIPIIMLSAEDDKFYYEKALQSGAQDFITKPFNFSEIIFKVKSCLFI
ncbi:MAG: response regulator receiver protein [Clostridia bacterium]|jgi:putative two-component system response regulator|nr:response regulator receiver protein [Clostridia bacterium]